MSTIFHRAYCRTFLIGLLAFQGIFLGQARGISPTEFAYLHQTVLGHTPNTPLENSHASHLLAFFELEEEKDDRLEKELFLTTLLNQDLLTQTFFPGQSIHPATESIPAFYACPIYLRDEQLRL